MFFLSFIAVLGFLATVVMAIYDFSHEGLLHDTNKKKKAISSAAETNEIALASVKLAATGNDNKRTNANIANNANDPVKSNNDNDQ